MTKALIIVDVQNDFITGSLPVPGGEDVALRIRDLVVNGDEGNAIYDYIVTTQDWHYNPGEHWSNEPDFKDTWPVHCKAGTKGAALHDDLKAIAESLDARFFKGEHAAAYSGFEGTNAQTPKSHLGLNGWLQQHDVTDVDVVGLALDYCVKATALDAVKLGFTTRVLRDLTAAVNSDFGGSGQNALVELAEAGVEVVYPGDSPAPTGGDQLLSKKAQLVELLKEVGGRYRDQPVHLATGEDTHVYLDVKGVLDRGSRLNLAADALIEHIKANVDTSKLTAIGGPTMGADVLAHVIVSRDDEGIVIDRGWKWFSVRDQAKTDHGLGRWIEGAELDHADNVVITDDVANSGKSLVQAVERVAQTGAKIVAVMPLVDRSDQARSKIEALGIPYLPLLTSADLGLEPLK